MGVSLLRKPPMTDHFSNRPSLDFAMLELFFKDHP